MTDRYSIDGPDWQLLRIGPRTYPCARFRKMHLWFPPPQVLVREALVPMENGWSALIDWGTRSFSANNGLHGEAFEEEPAVAQILIGESFGGDDFVLFLPYVAASEAIEILDAVSRWAFGVMGELAGTHEA